MSSKILKFVLMSFLLVFICTLFSLGSAQRFSHFGHHHRGGFARQQWGGFGGNGFGGNGFGGNGFGGNGFGNGGFGGLGSRGIGGGFGGLNRGLGGGFGR